MLPTPFCLPPLPCASYSSEAHHSPETEARSRFAVAPAQYAVSTNPVPTKPVHKPPVGTSHSQQFVKGVAQSNLYLTATRTDVSSSPSTALLGLPGPEATGPASAPNAAIVSRFHTPSTEGAFDDDRLRAPRTDTRRFAAPSRAPEARLADPAFLLCACHQVSRNTSCHRRGQSSSAGATGAMRRHLTTGASRGVLHRRAQPPVRRLTAGVRSRRRVEQNPPVQSQALSRSLRGFKMSERRAPVRCPAGSWTRGSRGLHSSLEAALLKRPGYGMVYRP